MSELQCSPLSPIKFEIISAEQNQVELIIKVDKLKVYLHLDEIFTDLLN